MISILALLFCAILLSISIHEHLIIGAITSAIGVLISLSAIRCEMQSFK
jgi:hypothetical protein